MHPPNGGENKAKKILLMGEEIAPERSEGIGVHNNPSTDMGYSWKYGSENSELFFKVFYTNDGDLSLKMLKGSMDLNALWFADNNGTSDDLKPLSGKDKSLNMNGTKVAWDSYAKISDTGLKDGELIEADQTVKLTDYLVDIDPSGQTLGIRATSVNGDDSVKLVSTAEFFDDIPPTVESTTIEYLENQKKGAKVGQVSGDDPEIGDSSGVVDYRFLNGSKFSWDGKFVINSDGEISFAEGTDTTEANDYETGKNSFKYEVQAIDSSGNISEAAPVTLNVVNDTSEDNLSFEDNSFTGWETTGVAEITGEYATEGYFSAKISTGADLWTSESESSTTAVTADSIAQFLGTTKAELETAAGLDLTEGSAIKTTLDVVTGDKISFDYKWVSTEGNDPTPYNDISFVVTGNGTEAITKIANFDDDGPIREGTIEFTATTNGTMDLGIGILDALDTIWESSLYIDNVVVA